MASVDVLMDESKINFLGMFFFFKVRSPFVSFSVKTFSFQTNMYFPKLEPLMGRVLSPRTYEDSKISL